MSVNSSYFPEALEFFYDFQWIYNTPVTEILLKKCLDKFPTGWLENLKTLNNDELNAFVVERKSKINWPRSLTSFLEKCEQVDNLSKPEPLLSLQLPSLFLKGLTPKKQHEILHLTDLVHRHCSEENISIIVDFGAGLGYVCQLLHYLHGYKILGLESNLQNVEIAQRRQKELYPSSENYVKYSQYEVTQFSVSTIQSKIQENFENDRNENICLIGLHACGDLSIWISQIFAQLENAKVLILISCCYHKMSMVKSEKGTNGKEFFESFPFSEALKKAIKSSDLLCEDFLKRTFLRLACQESADRWQGMSEDLHRSHAFHVIARGVLELYAGENRLRLTKLVQKATRKSQCENFEMYVKDCLKRYRFEAFEENNKNLVDSRENIENNLITLWNENEKHLNSAEIYTGLQLLLQSPAESLILEDRICWLREHKLSAEIVPVMKKSLSPRSHAIISKKNVCNKSTS